MNFDSNLIPQPYNSGYPSASPSGRESSNTSRNIIPESDHSYNISEHNPLLMSTPSRGMGGSQVNRDFLLFPEHGLNELLSAGDRASQTYQHQPASLSPFSSAPPRFPPSPLPIQHALLSINPISKMAGRCIVVAIDLDQPTTTTTTTTTARQRHARSASRERRHAHCDSGLRESHRRSESRNSLQDFDTRRVFCPYHKNGDLGFGSPSHLIAHAIRSHGFERRYHNPRLNQDTSAAHHKAPNFIQRSPNSRLPWRALCTWCYQAFATKEALDSHVSHPPKCPCNQNIFTRQRKGEIIRNLIDLEHNLDQLQNSPTSEDETLPEAIQLDRDTLPGNMWNDIGTPQQGTTGSLSPPVIFYPVDPSTDMSEVSDSSHGLHQANLSPFMTMLPNMRSEETECIDQSFEISGAQGYMDLCAADHTPYSGNLEFDQ